MDDRRTPAELWSNGMVVRTQTDILVVGSGPAGLATALLAHQAGFETALVGPDVNLDDARTTALMLPALETLEKLGIDTGFEGKAAPLKVMRIIDGTKRLIRSPVATFHANELGEPQFGKNIPNSVLNGALAAAVERTGVIWHKTLVKSWSISENSVVAAAEPVATIEAKLVAAADGRNSGARTAAGLTVRTRDYGQVALVTTISHELDHSGISTEFHTETGPFTIVPLPGHRSSLVWVVTPEEAARLADLPPDDFADRIEQRMDSILGKVAVEGMRQAYPLSSGLPSAFAARRIALVGEAAHVFPPIGAQGLNLGIRDANDLAEVARQFRSDPGAPAALTAFERARRPDILARTGAIMMLNRSLLTDFIPAQLVRSAGLAMLSGFAPLRGFFMREGMRPGSGLSALFSSVREQIRR